MSRRLYNQFGVCTACKDHSQLGEPCCNARVSFEGSTYSREEVIQIDADNGLSCDCDECVEDYPCGLDCPSDSECLGCIQLRKEGATQ